MSHREDEEPNASPLRLLDLLTIAELTCLSLSTIRREIRLRHLACHRIGRACRVSEADLAAFLAKRRRNVR